jgi:GNAT superfamily N-acetyltransferase
MSAAPGTPGLEIRFATPEDVPLVLSFIRGLAEYERLLPQVVATEEDVRESVFGARPGCEVLIATFDGRPAGFALFFHNYSTFLGRRGIYLEDLFVLPELRGKGIGKALLERLAAIALERGCRRLEWAVLDWNTPAIDFYQKLGAVPQTEWTVFRVTGDALKKLGRGQP